MSKSNAFEAAQLDLYFLNTDHANVGDASGLQNSASAGSFYFALHTADPGEAGNQSTSEVSYTGYARVAVARSGSGFTRSGSTISLVANVDFGQATAGSFPITASFWSVGLESAGATQIAYSGPLVPSGALFLPFTAATNDTITIPGHTFLVDDRCAFFAIEGGSLPTGMTEGTVYWVKTVSGDGITISTTQGGGTLDITAAGGGLGIEVSPVTINLNTIPRINLGAIIREG
jgi:hypothetical protein